MRISDTRRLKEINGFFWNNFTDSLIELVKARARDENTDARQRGSAITALRRGLSIFLRLFAPVVPYITEEICSWAFAEESGIKSIHRAPWPGDADFYRSSGDASSEVFDLAVKLLGRDQQVQSARRESLQAA
jgi:valyl-tRNA synthetase